MGPHGKASSSIARLERHFLQSRPCYFIPYQAVPSYFVNQNDVRAAEVMGKIYKRPQAKSGKNNAKLDPNKQEKVNRPILKMLILKSHVYIVSF